MRAAVLCLVAGAVLLAGPPRPLAAQAPTEDEVKAAYVFNFGRFVTWPPAAIGRQFEICVIGRDPLGTVIDRTVRGERLGGRPVVTRTLAGSAAAGRCQVLVVGPSEAREAADHLARVAGRPILTVGDVPRFVARGGMIEFVIEGSRVRFLVDPARADAAGLTLSSDLLRVARLFKPPAAPGSPQQP